MISQPLLAFVATALLAAVEASPFLRRDNPQVLPPSQDPFFQVPANVSAYKPGDIIQSRTPPQFSQYNYSAAYQFQYRTTDSLGNATAAVTTLIVPQNPDWEKLVSYQIPYDTPDVDCGPSYTIPTNGFTLGGSIGTLLNRGWLVNSPDYEGPNGHFTAGVISGQATLDSIRAVLASNSISGICPTARVGLAGYSGGALASEWAGELLTNYAPELTIAGAAIGGLTPDIRNVAIAVNNHTLSGLIPAGILGISRAYPNLTDFVDQNILPAKKADFFAVEGQCIATITIANHDKDYAAYFVDGFAALDKPVPASVIAVGGRMGVHGQPPFPLFVYKSVFDEVSPVNDTDALVQKYCENGAQIQYERYNYGDHLQASDDGTPGALAFLDKIMAGTLIPTGCNITTIQTRPTAPASTTA